MNKSLKQALDELAPLSSDEIASHLASLHILVNEEAGWSWSYQCPLAIYLWQQTGRRTAVTRRFAAYLGSMSEECRLPQSIFNFVLNVDIGKYPQLRKGHE
jgi:hypothetical protein